MTTSDWINLAAAISGWIGILCLGIIAWLTIRQTKNIQKAEKKERLLNEIIEWAVSIGECSRSSMNLTAISTLADPTRVWTFAYATIGNLDLSLSRMELRGKYISQVVLIFPKNLQIAVKELTNNLTEHRKLISESGNTTLGVTTNKLSKFNDAVDKVIAHEPLLGKYVNKVIEEATRIKTRDIGKKEEHMSKKEETTGSNEPTLKDIEEHLKQQDIQMARTQWQWLFILGVSAMAVGLAWIIATTPITQGDFKSGLFVFLAGLLIALLSLFYRYRKKS